MLITPIIDDGPLNEFLGSLYDASDLRSGSAFAAGVDDAVDAYFDFTRQRFDTYSERGGDWAEHAPLTQKIRGEGAPILIDQGDLRDSMERGDANHVHLVDADRITEGTEDPKARFHQNGTDRMPARPIIVNPDDGTLQDMHDRAAEGMRQTVSDLRGR